MLLLGPLVDAFPWQIVPYWKIWRPLMYFWSMFTSCVMTARVYWEPARSDNAVLFSYGGVRTTVVELHGQAGWNTVLFFFGLLCEAVVHTNSYTIWKSRLAHEPLVSGGGGLAAGVGAAAAKASTRPLNRSTSRT